jgi:multidrug efflux system outer membrane protein
MKKRIIFTAVSMAILSSGCSTRWTEEWGYIPPASGIEGKQFTIGEEGSEVNSNITYVENEALRTLIDKAMAWNADIKQAKARLKSVQAQYQITRSYQRPQVGLNGAVDQSGVNGQSDALYSVGFSINQFEIDLFNRLGALTTSAMEMFEAEQYQVRSVQNLVKHTVISRYLDMEYAHLKMKTLEQIEGHLNHQYHLHDMRLSNGLSSEDDVRRARIALSSIESRIASERNALKVAKAALFELTGESVEPSIETALDQRTILKPLNATITSDELLNRPDIKYAEHQLKAQNANIEAARAALFPRITLTASAGYQSDDLGRLLKGDTAWSISPGIYLPIFNRAALKSNVLKATADQEEAVASYVDTVRTAFFDLSSAVSQIDLVNTQKNMSEGIHDELMELETLTKSRFNQGQINLLPVLDQTIARLNHEFDALGIEQYRYKSINMLHQALGH